MADDDTTKQVAGIQERLDQKRNDAAEHLSGFSARGQAESVENDATLRDLLTKLRLKWRAQHPGDSLLAQDEISENS